jgi:uncharacterized membrane protein YfcA
VLAGLLGVGGGFIMVPLLTLWAGLGEHAAHGTSLAAIIPTAAVGASIYYFGSAHPAVDLHFALALVVGSVAGAYLGARWMARIPEPALKALIAVLLVAVAIKELVVP